MQILSADASKQFPKLAESLALESDLPSAVALEVLAAASEDRAAAVASHGAKIAEMQKTLALPRRGAVNFQPDSRGGSHADAVTGWKKAVTAANKGIPADAEVPAGASHSINEREGSSGWSKAVAAANAQH